MIIRKRKDEEDDDNHDEIGEVNNDKDTPSKSTENMDTKIARMICILNEEIRIVQKASVQHL